MWEKKESFKDRFTKERIKEAITILSWGYRKLNLHYKIVIFLNTVLQAIPSALGIYRAWVNKELINSAVNHEQSLFYKYITIIVALSLFDIVYGALYGMFIVNKRSGMNNLYKKIFYKTMLQKEYSSLEKYHKADLQSRLNNDIGRICNEMFNLPSSIINMLIQIFGTLGLLYTTSPKVSIAAIGVGLLISFVNIFFSKKKQGMYQEQYEKGVRYNTILLDHLSNLMVFRSFNKEDSSYQIISDSIEDMRESEIRINKHSTYISNVNTLIVEGVSMISTVYFLAQVLNEKINVGTYSMILGLFNRLRGQIGSIFGILPTIYGLLMSSDRLYEIEQLPNDLDKEAVSEKDALEFYNTELKAIQMKNITFAYPGAEKKKVLKKFNLTINKGEYLAITGLSGCGKSTTQKLLLSLYKPKTGQQYLIKEKGKIKLDSSWRSLFSYVPQRNLLFYGTIKEILSFGIVDKDDDKYWEALRIACAEDFVRELPDQLESQLGENGQGLSEGQVQRLAIARAIYSQRPILLLDECTSSLDGKTEQQLLRNLRSMTNKTVIIVTHRLAALKYCDSEFKFVEE